MKRKLIKTEKGAIAVKGRALWDAAREKLVEAEHALDKMRNAQNRVSYESAWSCFVDSIEEFWCRFFDEGKSTFTAFQPWAGAIDKERKSDELLQYFYQARHQSQHGRIPMSWDEPKLILGRGFSGRLYGLRIYPDGSYEDQSRPSDPNAKPFLVEHAPGKPILPTIENKRHKQLFSPPTHHRGKSLSDRSPVAVAKLILGYYDQVLAKAVEKFCCQGVA